MNLTYQNSLKWLAISAGVCLLGLIFWFFRSTIVFHGDGRGSRSVVSHSTDKVATPPDKSFVQSSRHSGILAHSQVEKTKDDTDSAHGSFKNLSLKELWSMFATPVAETNLETIASAGKWISERLGQSAVGSIDIYTEIAKGLSDESLNESERVGLARILSESDTPEALSILIKASIETENKKLNRSILELLYHLGSPRSSEQRTAMGGVAQSAWPTIAQSGESAKQLYLPIGTIMAKLGEPEGIIFLRSQATYGGLTIAQLEATGSEASIAAMNASYQVRGASSVPVLVDALRSNDPTATEFIWSGQALASLSRPEATSALIEWTKVAPDSCAETAAAWLGLVRDSRSHALVLEFAINGEKLHFASSRVKTLVLASANRLTTK